MSGHERVLCVSFLGPRGEYKGHDARDKAASGGRVITPAADKARNKAAACGLGTRSSAPLPGCLLPPDMLFSRAKSSRPILSPVHKSAVVAPSPQLTALRTASTFPPVYSLTDCPPSQVSLSSTLG